MYEAVCEIGSAVYGSASNSEEVRSVRGSPVGQEHRTLQHTLQRPPTRLANLHRAPKHPAAPTRTAAEEKREVISHVNACLQVRTQ